MAVNAKTLEYVPGRDNAVIANLPANVNDPGVKVELATDKGFGPGSPVAGVTPNNMPQQNPLAGMNVSKEAAGLFVDPTPAFQPALDFIAGQRTKANERYAQNKADIANIFGNLTQVNQESQNRVRQQFEQSIAQQQMATAQRLAQARTGAEQTQQAAIRAMDERGGGPMGNLNASPAAVASERAIGDIGSYAQIWEGQQGAIQQQTQQDLQAGLRSLGQQQVQADLQLKRSLEDTLNQLSGQETGIRSDLAQAIIGGKSQVAQANYNEILAKKAADEARRLASIRGYYDVQQAKIDAQSKLERAQLEAQNRVVNYPDDSKGVESYLRNNGITDPSRFWGTIDSISTTSYPNATAAYRAWLDSVADENPSNVVKNAARDWFNTLRYNADATQLSGGQGWNKYFPNQ